MFPASFRHLLVHFSYVQIIGNGDSGMIAYTLVSMISIIATVLSSYIQLARSQIDARSKLANRCKQ